MDTGVRTTMNNARKGKNGVFLAKHLDSPEGKAGKMNGILAKWSCSDDKDKPFEDVEAEFYEEHFRAGLDAQNERHRKKGNKKRIKTMDEYRTHEDYCPESTLYYLGDKNKYADPRILLQVVTEFLNWREKRFPSVVNLDGAMHKEDGAPHVHDRHLFIGHDENGNEISNQGKALDEMGIQPPDLDKARKAAEYRAQAKEASTKEEREKLIGKAKAIEHYNNAKMTYTRECREKLTEIARSYGVEVIAEPREKGKQGRTQEKFQTDDNNEKLEKQNKELLSNEKALASQRSDRDELTREIAEKQAQLDKLKQEMGDTLEYKAYCMKRETERAAKRAVEEKAIQEKQDAERAARKESQQPAEEKIGFRRNPQKEENAREDVQNAPETSENKKPIPDIAKTQMPLKNDRRPSVEKPKECNAFDKDGNLTPATLALFARMGIKPPNLDDDEDDKNDRGLGE